MGEARQDDMQAYQLIKERVSKTFDELSNNKNIIMEMEDSHQRIGTINSEDLAIRFSI